MYLSEVVHWFANLLLLQLLPSLLVYLFNNTAGTRHPSYLMFNQRAMAIGKSG